MLLWLYDIGSAMASSRPISWVDGAGKLCIASTARRWRRLDVRRDINDETIVTPGMMITKRLPSRPSPRIRRRRAI